MEAAQSPVGKPMRWCAILVAALIVQGCGLMDPGLICRYALKVTGPGKSRVSRLGTTKCHVENIMLLAGMVPSDAS